MNIPDEDLFSEITVECTVSYFVKIIGCFRCFLSPALLLSQCIALYAVAKGWLFLDIGLLVSFLNPKVQNFLYFVFVVCINATAALYFKVLSFWNVNC